jgi:hypothetical protein
VAGLRILQHARLQLAQRIRRQRAAEQQPGFERLDPGRGVARRRLAEPPKQLPPTPLPGCRLVSAMSIATGCDPRCAKLAVRHFPSTDAECSELQSGPGGLRRNVESSLPQETLENSAEPFQCEKHKERFIQNWAAQVTPRQLNAGGRADR